jgi:ABC-type oligopeptide transport system substrate-binding subunit
MVGPDFLSPLSVPRRLVSPGALALVLALTALAGPSYAADPVTITMARNADMLTFDPSTTEDDPSIFVELQVYDRLVKLQPRTTAWSRSWPRPGRWRPTASPPRSPCAKG